MIQNLIGTLPRNASLALHSHLSLNVACRCHSYLEEFLEEANAKLKVIGASGDSTVELALFEEMSAESWVTRLVETSKPSDSQSFANWLTRYS